MHRLIDKSFSCGTDQHFKVVTLDDAIDILQAEQVMLIRAWDRIRELEAEKAKLTQQLDELSGHTLHLIPRFKRMREIIREHLPHLEHDNEQSR